jgi:hypothetical protein
VRSELKKKQERKRKRKIKGQLQKIRNWMKKKPIQWTEQPTGALTSAGQLKVQKGLLAFEW